MWDFSIQTDHVIEARRPDLVVVDKKERSCNIIDFAVPGDSSIEEKEKDKIEKYEDLGRELPKISNVNPIQDRLFWALLADGETFLAPSLKSVTHILQ